MNTTNSRMAALFTLYVGLSTPAHAYLDPATGSIILQALVGAVGTWMVYSRLFMERTRSAFAQIFKRNDASKD